MIEDAPKLTADSRPEDANAYLRWIQDRASELDPLDRATVREQAVAALERVESVSAPTNMVDAALNGTVVDADDDRQGQGIALSDPEPWPDPVDGAELLEALEGTFTTYLALPDGAATALALWTVHAHAHDASPVSPVLALTSPEKRCGKTTLLELLSALVPRPLPASNLTPAVVFRAVERWEPTLLVDEANTFLRDGSKLRGVLNSGHRRSMAFIPRCVGDDHEVSYFRTWAPKAIALIGELPDTLGDRSVEVRMRRRAPDEEVDRLRRDRLEEMEPLRRKAWTWARRAQDNLRGADPHLPSSLHDRERDNWRPLLAVADAAGGRWGSRGREAAKALQEGERDDRSLGTRLLADVREILEGHPSDRIRSKKLVGKLCALEEAPWAEYKGRGLSTVSLANFLRSFDVSSTDLRFSSGVYKGYTAEAFEDAFRRYLDAPPSGGTPSEGATTQQSPRHGGSDGNPGRNTEGDVAGRESPDNPHNSGDVAGVAGREGDPGEGEGPDDDGPPLFDFDSATGAGP